MLSEREYADALRRQQGMRRLQQQRKASSTPSTTGSGVEIEIVSRPATLDRGSRGKMPDPQYARSLPRTIGAMGSLMRKDKGFKIREPFLSIILSFMFLLFCFPC